MTHGQHVLGDEIPGPCPDHGSAQNAVPPRRGQYLDEALGIAFGNGAVELRKGIAGHFVGDAARLGFPLVEPYACHLRVGEGGVRNHPVVHLEGPAAKPQQGRKQAVHRRVPGHMRRGMGELVGTGDIAAGKDVGHRGLQHLVDLQALSGADAQCLQAKALQPRLPPDCDQQRIERDWGLSLGTLYAQPALAVTGLDRQRPGVEVHRYAFPAEALRHGVGDLGVFAHHQLRCSFHQSDLTAQAREGLGQFASDGTAAEHHQAPRQCR